MDKQSTDHRKRVRQLNDDFRCRGIGRGSHLHTNGVHERGPGFVLAASISVAQFTDFGPNNDPYSEHDFGAFTIDGERLFFKIDLYEEEFVKRAHHASVVIRVLTRLWSPIAHCRWQPS